MSKSGPLDQYLLVIIGALLGVTLLVTRDVIASRTSAPAAGEPKLHYQGRLLDPATGAIKPDGAYPMTFGVYTQASGGAALWTETKDVTVSKGIFSTLLGDTTPLGTSIFNGQDLWLGITVSSDPQMTPRQPLGYVPYAIHAQDADTLNGSSASAFAPAGHGHFALPIAYGSVRWDGALGVGSYNVASVTWNASLNRYEIDIVDIYYSIDDVTVATVSGDSGSCPGGASARQSSVSGHLLIYIVDKNDAEIQCSFRFVTYAGP